MEDKRPGTPWGVQGDSGKWRKWSPPTPTRGLRTTPSAILPRPHCGGRGRSVEIPCTPTAREVLGCHPSTPKATPTPVGGEREKGLRAGGAPRRNPHAAGRRQTQSSPGHPRGAQAACGGGKGGGDGCPSLRGPDSSAQVQSPSPAHTHRPGSGRQDPP